MWIWQRTRRQDRSKSSWESPHIAHVWVKAGSGRLSGPPRLVTSEEKPQECPTYEGAARRAPMRAVTLAGKLSGRPSGLDRTLL